MRCEPEPLVTWFCVFSVAVALLATPSIAQENLALQQHETLAGHESVVVEVMFGQPEEAGKLALRKETLQQFCVDSLKASGVRATAKVEDGVSLRMKVGIDLLPLSDRYYTFQTSVAISQAALLTNKKICVAQTWFHGKFGGFPKGEQALLKSSIEEGLAEFVRDLQKANPPASDPFAGER